MAFQILRRSEDLQLLAHQFVVFALYGALFVAFPAVPVWAKITIYFTAATLSQRYEGSLHYSSHHPVFRSSFLNKLHRLSYALFPPPAVLYRADHFHHHKFNNKRDDMTSTLNEAGTEHMSVWEYTWDCLTNSKFRVFYDRLSKADKSECLMGFALYFALLAALFSADPWTTLVYWLPMSSIVCPVVMDLHCYFDHVPGNPYDEFQQATWFDGTTPLHRVYAALDMYNAAYHLTHHRFPSIHWADIHNAQEKWVEEYRRRNSPLSVGYGASMLLNPFSFVWHMFTINSMRRDIPIVVKPKERRFQEDSAVELAPPADSGLR